VRISGGKGVRIYWVKWGKAREKSHAKTSSLVVRRRRKQSANPAIAQPESCPEKNRDVDGKKSVSEERASDAYMRGDGSAQIARP
jgi:hypothetical protein